MKHGKQDKKEKHTLDDESMTGDQEELSNVDNIISNFESKGLDKKHRALEDDPESTRKRVREKGSTPEALQKTSQIAIMSLAGGQSKLVPPGKLSLPTK